MRFTADTNLLVRIIVRDDARQSTLAETALVEAEIVAVSPSALCELVWVLSRGYKIPPLQIFAAIETLISTKSIVTNQPAVEAGLAMLKAGGDFADGVIAYEGSWLGGTTFLTFDKKAAKLLDMQGKSSHLLS